MLNQFEVLRRYGSRALKAKARALFQRPRRSGHVLMLHNGRSGSTLLGDMLDQHDEIFWDGETIEKKLHRTAKSTQAGFENMWQTLDLVDGINEVHRRMQHRAGRRIFGTEIQDYQVLMMGTDIRQYIQGLRSLGFTRFIFLERNYLRKVASAVVATKRHRFHIHSRERSEITSVRINPERLYIGHRYTTLLGVLRQFREFKAKALEELGEDNVLMLSYETDIQSDPNVAARKVCQFLEIPPHRPKVNFGKTTDSPLSQIVENFDEIREVLLNSEFADEMLKIEVQTGGSGCN